MKALILDVDDTLYDQIQPFRQAVNAHLDFDNVWMDDLYLAFRKRADEVFEAATSGAMSLADSHLYRMKMALLDLGYEVSDETAMAIQQTYQTNQGSLTLSPEFEAIFDWCQEEGIELGVITNGPHLHQLRKIQSMNLTRWIDEKNILISEQVGVSKPCVRIFRLMEERLSRSGDALCYLGDSYENDVIGAKEAGWQAVWLNHRRRTAPVSPYQPDKVVSERFNILSSLQQLHQQP